MPAVLLLCCTLLGWARPAFGAEAPQRMDRGIVETRFQAVAAHPRLPHHLYAATQRAVYRSSDGGQTWREAFRLPAQASATALAVSEADDPTVLAATTAGLYRSADGGQRWTRARRGASDEERYCTVVAFSAGDPATALLGTRGGLFVSRDAGRHWREVGAPPAAREVVHAAFDPQEPQRLYVVSREGFFTGSLTQGGWQQRLGSVQTPADEANLPDTADDDSGEAAAESESEAFRSITVDPQQPERLYLATDSGIRISEDRGEHWQPLPGAGLLAAPLSRLLALAHSPVALYVGTARGVARYETQTQQWQPLAPGLAAAQVHDLAASGTGLWAATDEGLYRFAPEPAPFAETPPPSAQELLGNFVHEPTIAHVQAAAIGYAEVHPDKIRRWRRQAALKALLPTVSLDRDRDYSRDVSVDEGSFPNFQRIETEDRDFSHDLSIHWDLGELLWNDDQTSIDVRSKLMVQLRDDILDEVTRTYFERRRLQVQLLTQPPADQSGLLDKELRIQELTALLDGLTGGYFSKHVGMPRTQEGT